MFYVGIPEPNGSLLKHAISKGWPVMVSASRLWKKNQKRFQMPGQTLRSATAFLDSAGFTAMKAWGGFPWTPKQYMTLAASMEWEHWSQMDLCCEREVASDHGEVTRRVVKTSEYLRDLTIMADEDWGIPRPLPILQGWKPDDYRFSAQLVDGVLDGRWPSMVGVGSVCRRQTGGDDGLVKVIRAILDDIPTHVSLHLFGVKADGLGAIGAGDRVTSSDSMAWDFHARMKARKAGVSFTIPLRIEEMDRWMERQGHTLPAPLARPSPLDAFPISSPGTWLDAIRALEESQGRSESDTLLLNTLKSLVTQE